MSETTEAVLVACCRYPACATLLPGAAQSHKNFKAFLCMWSFAGLFLTQKNLQCSDPWMSFQSLNTVAWSEKRPFCRSFQASLSSTFRSHLFHSLPLEETEGLLLKGHYKIGVQLPTAHCQFSSLVEWFRADVRCQIHLGTGELKVVNKSPSNLFVFVVFQACLSPSPSLPASQAFLLWAILPWLCSPCP